MELDQAMRKEKKFGYYPDIKLVGGLILLAVLAVLFMTFLGFVNNSVNTKNDLEAQTGHVEFVHKSVEKQLNMFQAAGDLILQTRLTGVELTALAQKAVVNEPEKLPCMTSRGALVRNTDGVVTLPEQFPEEVRINGKRMTGDSGVIFTADDDSSEENAEKEKSNPVREKELESDFVDDHYLFYSRIAGDVFYVEWISYDEYLSSLEQMYRLDENMEAIEKALNVRCMLFLADPLENGHVVIYHSSSLPFQVSAENYGITDEMLSDVLKVNEEPTKELIGRKFRKLSIDDVSYGLLMQEYESALFDQKTILALLVPLDNTLKIMNERAMIVVAAFVLIGVFFTVWHSFTRYLVMKHSLNDRQGKELGPRSIARKTVFFIVVGCVIILALYALMVSLFRLYLTSKQVDNAFMILRQRISEEKNQSEMTETFHKEAYERYVRRIAELLDEHPEMATADNLDQMSRRIGANYIMLFDEDGNEILSNSRYSGLKLGKDPSSATYEFRILLTGTRLVTHDLAVDEATGEKNVMIGASFGRSEEGGKYKAVLVAVPGEKIYHGEVEDENAILSTLVEDDKTAYGVDPETRLILHASDEELIGKNAIDLGLPEHALNEGYRDFFTMGGVSWFGECEKLNSTLYIYAAKQSSIFVRVVEQSLIAAGAAFILLSVLGLFLLSGYRKFFEKWSEVGGGLNDSADEVTISGVGKKFSIDPSNRWKQNAYEVGVHLPLQVAKLVTELLFMVLLILMSLYLMSATGNEDTSLISYILHGRWGKGVNLFAFTSILIMLSEITVVSVGIRIVLYLISGVVGTRGETVCRLLSNLVSYLALVAFLYFALYYLGCQPDALLASLGLLSFAVSLGAKDLITDIIAGLSIVFEGTYQVGDIIDVGGYRGEVLEIGVRTTKIEGRGGNIKIIGNRDIKNVINMTRKNSWCALEISIPANQPIREVEALLKERLARIGESNPEIVSGPYYKGIVALGKGSVTLSIIAECNEADIHSVQRWMYHAIEDLFTEKGIPLA